MSYYKDLFNDKSANLADQDYIAAATGSWASREIAGINVGMTSFRAFIETGDMKFHGPEGVITIDFSKDDALMRSMKAALEDAEYEVRNSDEFSVLMEADPPTLEQRLAYEQTLSRAVFGAIEGIDGLKNYRLDKDALDGKYSQSSNEIKPDNNLNSLSQDIEGKADSTQSYRTDFECEKMSALKGMLMQGIEDSLLPENDGSLQSAGTYFNAQGGIYNIKGFAAPDLEEVIQKDDFKVDRGWHAFITSSKSGAVFEATAVKDDDDAYSNLYGEDRMLIPVSDNGHLPEQAPYNQNFGWLVAGARVAYVKMDPEHPGSVHPEADMKDLTFYQVGSNDQLVAERMYAIQSGHVENLDDLQKMIPQMSMDSFREDLRFAGVDLTLRQLYEITGHAVRQYDPNNEGPTTFLDNFMTKKMAGYDGLPDCLVEAFQTYAQQGNDIPDELLAQIAQEVDSDMIHKAQYEMYSLSKNVRALRHDMPKDIGDHLEKSGLEAEYADIYESDLHYRFNDPQYATLEQAAAMAQTLSNIVYKAQDHQAESVLTTGQGALVSQSGDQNIAAAQDSEQERAARVNIETNANPSL